MLDQDQLTAARHGEGPCLVLAGPGSGKTTVITERVRFLTGEQGVSPERILVVTFSKAAASEMKTRYLRLTGNPRTAVAFGTFHAVFFHILKQAYHLSAENILREEMRFSVVRNLVRQLRLETDDENELIGDILSEIGIIKGSGIEITHYYAKSCSADAFRRIYEGYEAEKGRRKLLDFDDMLTMTKELLIDREDIRRGWQDRFRYLLVDEFQDINRLQYEVVKLLAAPENNLFVVGDDDQSIYRFRGASPEIMLHFPEDYPLCKKVLLGTNYRCQANVVTAAGRLISHNEKRFLKKLTASRAPGSAVRKEWFADAKTEAEFIVGEIRSLTAGGCPYAGIAVLFRTNHGMRPLVERFLAENIPFLTRDHIPNLYQHWIAQDIFAYLALSQGSRDRADLLRVMNRPKRYMSRDVLTEQTFAFDVLEEEYRDKPWVAERIEELERDLAMLSRMNPYAGINFIRRRIGYDDFCREYAEYRNLKAEELTALLDELQEAARGFRTLAEWRTHIDAYTAELLRQSREAKKEENAVTLSTLHSAKGLEYDCVFLYDMNEGMMPYHRAVLAEDLEEERRLVYVGMTRAKKELYLCAVASRASQYFAEIFG